VSLFHRLNFTSGSTSYRVITVLQLLVLMTMVINKGVDVILVVNQLFRRCLPVHR